MSDSTTNKITMACTIISTSIIVWQQATGVPADWVTYVVTFIAGFGLGYSVRYFIARRREPGGGEAERDGLREEAKRLRDQLDQEAPAEVAATAPIAGPDAAGRRDLGPVIANLPADQERALRVLYDEGARVFYDVDDAGFRTFDALRRRGLANRHDFPMGSGVQFELAGNALEYLDGVAAKGDPAGQSSGVSRGA